MTRAPRPAKRPDYAVLVSAAIFDLLLYASIAWTLFVASY